jgi:hypothetical protein
MNLLRSIGLSSKNERKIFMMVGMIVIMSQDIYQLIVYEEGFWSMV